MPEMNAVAKRLKAYRLSNNMTQFEMGSEMGLSTEEISLIERRKKDDMKLSTLQKIAAHMGITVSSLVAVEANAEGKQDGI